MELYDIMRDISGKSNENELINAITCVKQELSGLTEERMCKVYSSFLLKELLKHHIPSRLINTLDLGLNYEHIFVLVAANQMEDYFLLDLTFSQFKTCDHFTKLLTDGYQKVNDNDLNYYLNIITKANFTNQFSLDNIFFSISTSHKHEMNLKK